MSSEIAVEMRGGKEGARTWRDDLIGRRLPMARLPMRP